MKILAIVGSPRKKGNTDILVDNVCLGIQSQGLEVEKIYLSDYKFEPCIGCEGCSKTCKCVLKDDMQVIYKKLDESHGIILGSPTYFYNVSALTKKFIDRLYAYDIFDPEDRSVWLSPNEVFGLKYAVTVAVCEQEDESDMGVTSDIMVKTLASVGYRTVSSIKALHLFKKGAVNDYANIQLQAKKAGEKLAKTLKLYSLLKENHNNLKPN